MKKLLPTVLICMLSAVAYSQTPFSEADKLTTFSKVWGFLKYYHPVVATGSIDWDTEFMVNMDSVRSMSTKQALSNFYLRWIDKLGNIKACKKCQDHLGDALQFNLNNSWLQDTTEFTEDLVRQLQYILQNRNRGSNYYVQQIKYVGNTSYEHEKVYKDSVFPSPPLRLLGLSRYWNIINYFYPYKYVIGTDWDSVLTAMIPLFLYAKDTAAYHMAMLQLTAALHDSHAGFGSKYTIDYFGNNRIPFQFKIIDNKAVVGGYYDEELSKRDDIEIGDVFLKIGGVNIGDIIKEKTRYISASNNAALLRNFSPTLFYGNTDTVNVTFERKGILKQKILHRLTHEQINYKMTYNDTMVYTVLSGNIGLVNLGLLQPDQVEAVMERLRNKAAIIFDVRNYPRGTLYKIAEFLKPERTPFVKFSIPDVSYPGVFHYTQPYTCGKKNKHPYKGKIVLLFNELTQSHAEFTLMALQTAPGAIGIGSQTSGADGNVSLITFPGNFKTYMTGIGVYYPDGRKTQRIGIVPDIEVNPTIEGISQGRDEVLEKAIETVNGKAVYNPRTRPSR